MSTIATGISLARKAKSIGIVAIMLVVGYVALHVIGAILGIIATLATFLIPAILLGVGGYVLYFLFFKE